MNTEVTQVDWLHRNGLVGVAYRSDHNAPTNFGLIDYTVLNEFTSELATLMRKYQVNKLDVSWSRTWLEAQQSGAAK